MGPHFSTSTFVFISSWCGIEDPVYERFALLSAVRLEV